MKLPNSNLFNRYLPMVISVVLIVLAVGAYLIFRSSTPQAEAGWYASGGTWNYRKAITIDHTKITGTTTPLTNFPMLFSVTDTDLKTVTNGGKVGKDTGIDMLFTSADGTTKLSHQLEKYASTTGETIAWVKIPSLSPTTDTTIYVYFGNSSASDQQDAVNVWDTNFKGVWHLGEGRSTAASFYKDSTSNVNHGTLTDANANTTAATGQMDGAINLGGDADYISVGDPSFDFDKTNPFSASMWVKIPTVSTQQNLFGKFSGAGFTGWGMSVNPVGTTEPLRVFLISNLGASNYIWKNSLAAVDDNTWHYVSFTYNGSSLASGVNIYVDGSLANGFVESDTLSGSILNNASLTLGADLTTSSFVAGTLDEVHVSSAVRTAAWIATEYNNQKSPASFYSYGATQVQTRPAGTGGVSVASRGASSLGWYATGGTWTNRKAITIDHNKITGTTTPLSNFPMLFSVTDPDLKSVANSGKVASTTGADILFTSSDGTTKLSHELEKYDATTGQVIAWVKIPSLSPTTDTTIYVYFGNSTSVNQQDTVNVWDTNYKAVYHLPNGTSLTSNDSTTNGNNGTINGTLTAANAQVDGGAVFDNNPSNYIEVGNPASLQFSTGNSVTLSAWVKVTLADSAFHFIIDKSHSGSSGYTLARNNANQFFVANDSGFRGSTNTFTTEKWYYVTGVIPWNGSTYNDLLYINGVADNGGSSSVTATLTNSDTVALGREDNNSSFAMYGTLVEVRISNIARTPAWIATEYNNQFSPSTFYSYGALSAQTRTAVSAGGAGGGFTYYRSITVNSGQATTTQTNFPMLVSGTYTYLKTVGNGGKVQNASGFDVGFYSNANCSTGKLPWETEKYVASTGEVDYWVNVASVVDGATIYMCYGNSAVSSDQSNKTAVWDANYKVVYHLPDGTTLSANDSTGVNNGTLNSGPTAVAGQIGGAASFVPSANIVTNYVWGGTVNLTFSAWVKTTDSGAEATIFDNYNGSASDAALYLHSGKLEGFIRDSGTHSANPQSVATLNNGTWKYVTMTIGTGGVVKLYINGTQDGTATNAAITGNYGANGTAEEIARDPNNSSPFTGSIDEPRISNIDRSANWIFTEFNNQSSPSGFYSVGSENTLGGPATSAPAAAVKVRGGVKFH